MPDITLSLKLEGFAEFSRALRRLPGEISGRILQTALGAGAAIIRGEAVIRAPRPAERRRPRTVRLSDSIKIFPRERDAAHAVVDVGSKVPYAHLVELGHQIIPRGPSRQGLPRSRRKDTAAQADLRKQLRTALKERRVAGAVGFVAARPFLRPAFDENKERVIQVIGRTLGRDIERAFRRLVPKARAA